MKVTKAAIKREIKATGGVMKRTVPEIIEALQKYIPQSVTDGRSQSVVVTLFWTLGFTPEQANDAMKRLRYLS